MTWLVIALVVAAIALVLYDVRYGTQRRAAKARRAHPPTPPRSRSGDPRKRST